MSDNKQPPGKKGRRKRYPPNWEEGQSLPWELPPCEVEVGKARIRGLAFEEAFLEAVTAVYEIPGGEARVHDPEGAVLVFRADPDGALRVRRE